MRWTWHGDAGDVAFTLVATGQHLTPRFVVVALHPRALPDGEFVARATVPAGLRPAYVGVSVGEGIVLSRPATVIRPQHSSTGP